VKPTGFRQVSRYSAAITLIGQLEGLGLLWAIVPELVQLIDQSMSAVDPLRLGLMATDA
jgi:hypothetical protein